MVFVDPHKEQYGVELIRRQIQIAPTRLVNAILTAYLIVSNETKRLNGKYSAYGTATLKSTAPTKSCGS